MALANNLATRIARRVLQWAVGLYPPDKRGWGEAILAEGDSATELGEALSWMIGGLMVAFRAFFSRLIHRAAAKNEPVLIRSVQSPPPLPWKLALTCLAISGALLFVPDLRQALSVTSSSWRAEFAPRDETAMWEKLGREAEARGDAEAMAFVAMRLPDVNGDRFDTAVNLAEHAVAKDPSLTWTYYFLAQRRSDTRFRGAPRPELAQYLEEWDPKNAVPYLAEADAIASAHSNDPQWRVWPNINSPRPEDVAHLHGRDPQWLELMGRAFAAPTYDAYFDRRLDLDLRVMQRLSMVDPQRAANAYLFGNRLPNIMNLREYASLRVGQGEEAERSGQWEHAASEYWAVAQFGQRVCLGRRSSVDIEQFTARDLQEASFRHLQPVLLKLGHSQEAQTVAYAAQLQHSENDEARALGRAEWQRFFTFSLLSGMVVHLCAIVFGASALAMAILLLGFALKRAPRFVRLGLTYAPLLLVASAIGLLCTYHPYAESYRSYLANPSAQDRESIFNTLAVAGVPGEKVWIFPALSPTNFWWFVIAALGAICMWVVSRGLRPRHA